MHSTDGGLVSVQPHHRVERAYEQLSAYFNVVSLMASSAFTRGDRHRPMAFGPCLLTTRGDYERAGGHEAVRGEILDDAALPRPTTRRIGLPVRCAVGGRSISMRSYPGGLRQLASGWTKNIASGASAASPTASVATVLWVCAHHAVALGALLSLVDVVAGPRATNIGVVLVWAALWLLLALQMRAVLRRAGSFRWWAWALFPVPLLAFDIVFACSLIATACRRSVRWRGRSVDLRRPPSTLSGDPMLRLLMPEDSRSWSMSPRGASSTPPPGTPPTASRRTAWQPAAGCSGRDPSRRTASGISGAFASARGRTGTGGRCPVRGRHQQAQGALPGRRRSAHLHP